MALATTPATLTFEVSVPAPRPFVLDPRMTALVIVDVQERAIHEAEGHERKVKIVPALQRLLGKARAARATVVFIKSHRNTQVLERVRYGRGLWLGEDTPAVQIAREISPLPDELVVTKYTKDPWLHTRLEEVLAGRGIDPFDGTLIIAGVSTNGCAYLGAIGSSVREYMTLIPMDCTADKSLEDELLAYARYLSPSYRYNTEFTTGDLIAFEVRAERPELQLRRMREEERISSP